MQSRYGERYRWLLLLSVMVGTMAAIMSSTVVNVGIPGISQHFALGQDQAQWVSSSFMLASTVSMLTTPWLLARYGYRGTYAAAVLLLLIGGVLGGVAGTYPLVLAARVLEGLAAGVVQPIPAIIILRAFAPHEQGRATGIFSIGVVLAPAVGPSLGGVLIDWFGWRSIFYMVIPFCVASLWLAQRFVPPLAPGGAAPERKGPSLDWRGLLLCTTGTLCLLNGLVQLRGASGWYATGLLLAAGAALVLFMVWQRRFAAQGGEALMNLDLFRHRQFAMGSLVAIIYGTALFGSTYLLPIYMQLGLQLSASTVGTILLPSGLMLAATLAVSGRLADRQPAHILISIGLSLLAASFIAMRWMGLESAWWLLVLPTILGRIGLGFILPSLNLAAMRPLDRNLISQGASTINFLRTLGGAAGVSLCGIVLEWRLSAHGDTIANAASSTARLSAFNETFMCLAGLCGLAIVAAWQLRALPTRK